MLNVASAGGERYFIQFGSFKNYQGVERHINKMPKSLRSHVSIIRTNGWYVPFAYYKKSKKGLSSKVKVYRRYFRDAKIVHGRRMFAHKVLYKFGKRNYNVSKRRVTSRRKVSSNKVKYSKKRKKFVKKVVRTPKTRTSIPTLITLQDVDISMDENTITIPTENYSSQNIPSILEALPNKSSINSTLNYQQKNYKYFTKQMLSGNHYYMTYRDPKGESNLLIKVSFAANSVSYQPVLGDMQMTQANYLVKDHKLYMFADKFTSNGAYSTLDAHRRNFFIVSSWMGNKKLNTLRYYYRLNDAKAYLGVDVSSGLSEVLQEGSFDELFLSDDEY